MTLSGPLPARSPSQRNNRLIVERENGCSARLIG